ncbi:EXTENSIN PROLINE-RICH PROTEIN [Salix koriyanagi]|uniref:EXTENSIN PROLINE-RICH PROTEIN n=1 Tax=Salix koriyanagi TaxID=2511006 RepID=A0A9Q0QMI6_9ROSI|nr:EXTENSIN PROLINE-RICH PROTEIN [Salix koriyanagi]
MAVSKILIASLILSLLVLQKVSSSQAASDNPGNNIDCGGACKYRCSLSSRPHLCNRACGTCCARCKCVPAGTSGNLDACPCYATMTTHGGRRKCP